MICVENDKISFYSDPSSFSFSWRVMDELVLRLSW